MMTADDERRLLDLIPPAPDPAFWMAEPDEEER